MAALHPLIVTQEAFCEDDAPAIGAKAANLFRLAREGFPVPRTAALRAEALAAHLDGEDLAEILYAPSGGGAAEIGRRIRERPLPPPVEEALDAFLGAFFPGGAFSVAVRSSAFKEDSGESSFAGLYATVLDVADRAGLHRAVKEVWASLWDDGPCAWRQDRGLRHLDFTMAVILQQMCDASVSGVAFTRNPLEPARDEMLIQAAAGKGEALVSGRAPGQMLRLGRSPLHILGEGAPAFLADAALIGLGEILLAVEELFGAPQDVEWCFGGGLSILQARPILSLDREVYDYEPLRELVPPHVTPFTADLFCRLYRGGMEELLRHLTYEKSLPAHLLKISFGRPYLAASMTDAVSRDIGAALTCGGQHCPPAQRPYAEAFGRLRQNVGALLDEQWRRWREAAVGGIRDIVSALCEGSLLVALNTLADLAVKQAQSLCPPALARRLPGLLAHLPGEGPTLPGAIAGLAAAIQADPAASAALRTAQSTAAFVASLEAGEAREHAERFLRRFGEWGAGCDLEVAAPRLEEGDALLHLLREGAAASDGRGSASFDESLDVCACWFDGQDLPWEKRQFLKALDEARELLALRERQREQSLKLLAALRRGLLEKGARLAEEGALARAEDVFFLAVDEVIGDGGENLRQKVRERIHLHERWMRQALPGRIVGGRPEKAAAAAPHRAHGAARLIARGQGVSPGNASGVVVILRRFDARRTVPEGAILVTPAADPCWAFYFNRAGGFIAEVGGVLAHSALLAREMGLPAVMQAPGIVDLLEDGERVRIDGLTGEIFRE